MVQEEPASKGAKSLQNVMEMCHSGGVQLRLYDQDRAPDSNFPFGDEIKVDKGKDILRVYFQNANSIRSTRLEKLLDICVSMKRMNVDLFGIVEININPPHPGLADEVAQIAQRTWTHAKTCLANTAMDCRG